MMLVKLTSFSNFTTGYIPQGSYVPDEYPSSIYGTEVFEVNTALREKAVKFARKAKLEGSTAALNAYRKHYAKTAKYAAGGKAPSVIECDVATSVILFNP